MAALEDHPVAFMAALAAAPRGVPMVVAAVLAVTVDIKHKQPSL
jgi:hypothetical protein